MNQFMLIISSLFSFCGQAMLLSLGKKDPLCSSLAIGDKNETWDACVFSFIEQSISLLRENQLTNS
jgi:hypothetical protein